VKVSCRATFPCPFGYPLEILKAGKFLRWSDWVPSRKFFVGLQEGEIYVWSTNVWSRGTIAERLFTVRGINSRFQEMQ
jgi:hypothetical protein